MKSKRSQYIIALFIYKSRRKKKKGKLPPPSDSSKYPKTMYLIQVNRKVTTLLTGPATLHLGAVYVSLLAAGQ